MRRPLLACLVLLALLAPHRSRAADFAADLNAAKGQTVDFFAWGGSPAINAYLAWVAGEVKDRFGIDLRHVKLADTSDAVAQVLAEKAAGRTEGGAIDLVWINGENFRAMKDGGLLDGPFALDLPNFALVDTNAKPTTLDFTVSTEGYESPWGSAQFVLIHDMAETPEAPDTLATLQAWIMAHPGRFTLPAPPDFVGTTFLKHLLIGLAGKDLDPTQPPPADAAKALAPVRDWLAAVRPALWRQGTAFPPSGPALHQLFEDGAVDFTMAFNPAEAATYVADGRFPETTRSYILKGGTIANVHFVAIPFDANDKAGARVVANFLLSPEAQAKKQDPDGWGDFTVLDMAKLDPAGRALFARLKRHPATPTAEGLVPALSEPHPGWVPVLERFWAEDFGG